MLRLTRGAGLVAFTLVGLLDTSVREARDRVRAAFESCGLDVLDQRITVNLSPAGIPKSGSVFDLAIASSIALATGLVLPRAFEDSVIVGELALDGSIQPVRGVLPAVLSARSLGVRRVIVPSACAREAQLVSGIEVIAFEHLADMIAWGWGRGNQAPFHGHLGVRRRDCSAEDVSILDMADVRGQPEAVAAMEVAAAGGHHVFLLGEPGSGKTMLASRLPTILPDLDPDTALVTTSLHSVAGLVPTGTALVTRPPFQAPHHSVTMAALIGGGSRTLTPGAVSLAHGGILFLDEAAEFAPSVLDSLREPWNRVLSTCTARVSTRATRLRFNWSWHPTRARAEGGVVDAAAPARPSRGVATWLVCRGRCWTAWTFASTCIPRPARTWQQGTRVTRRPSGSGWRPRANEHDTD